ncbi:MAG: hypothetical protein MO846_02810 [Candidatus Devosia symbiotica]|nr:hypothetical protein [Candidatus Devosia symbiotica]
MNIRPAIFCLTTVTLALGTQAAFTQDIEVTHSVLPDQSYTLIYPDTMEASGGIDKPLTINNPNAPLQCTMSYVPVDQTDWTPEDALASLVTAEVEAGWRNTFPGFVLGAHGPTAYQSDRALLYEGTSTDSPMGVPLTIIHTETVAHGLGYTLDCLFDTTQAEQARPIIDFIIANFSTNADAECCVAVSPLTEIVPAQ